jgi:hypothetical protein
VKALALPLLASLLYATFPTFAGEADWKRIGQEDLTPGRGEVTIAVGSELGPFRGMRLTAEGGEVYLRKVTFRTNLGTGRVLDGFGTIGPSTDARALPASGASKALVNRVVVEYETMGDSRDVKLVAWGRRAER